MRSVLLVGMLAASVGVLVACDNESIRFDHPALTVIDAKLSHPTDIVKFKDHYVATELHNNRLAIFSDLRLGDLYYFDPQSIKKQFRAPHFLAVTAGDTLLISNGWGNSIVEISGLDGTGWREFTGVGRKFRAPHGVCVDKAGWIYVGDSLNSRLVRFRDMTGKDWQVFADKDKRVSYIRQLVCRDGVVWASNSYENKPGLNPGQGGNILKISDFVSGQAEIVFAFPKSNLTGVMPIDDSRVLIGLWSIRRQLVLHDAKTGQSTLFGRIGLGTPYGIFIDQSGKQVLVAHIGRMNNRRDFNSGGIAVYRP